jgi:hypothetical protein
MQEVLSLPIELQEPAEPYIPKLVEAEGSALHEDIAALAGIRGIERVMEDLQEPYGKHFRGKAAAQQGWGRLDGQNVIDLGCGPYDYFRQLLKVRNIKSYIGVDLFPGELEGESIVTPMGTATILPGSSTAPGTPEVIVKGDMLDLASRLPDASSSFAINGLDDYIVDSQGEYGQELIRQIDRVTAVGGLVTGVSRMYGILSTFENCAAYQSFACSEMFGYRYETHIKIS